MKLNTPESIAEFNGQIRLSSAPIHQVGLLAQNDILELYISDGANQTKCYEIDKKLFPLVEVPESKYNPILYGKNGLEGIVGAEADGENLILFIQKGSVTETKIIPNRLWVTACKNHDGVFSRLDGDREYKFIKYYKDVEKWNEVRKLRYESDLFASYCPVESNFIARGFTYFKGLQIKDVPVLSFDIETDGLERTPKSEIYLISNTFRVGDYSENKLFDLADYPSQKEMLLAWCSWVREKNPAIMLGHNIYGYDLPYLKHVASLNDVSLNLGRDGSAMTINEWPSKFRKDGNEKIDYFKCNIWGRELVDTYFLSFKYDTGRKYLSNGLKQIIKQEGLEKQGRSFVDAGRLKQYRNDPEMWQKVRQYASEDSDDALKLFDLMAPAFFYSTQMIPKRFSDIMTGASGSQINSIMLRCYLQEGESIPKASMIKKFEGAISRGRPGIYRNCIRWDVASLYPSIMKEYQIYSPKKDPKKYILYTLFAFLDKRLEHKKLAKETGDKYHEDMQGALKILANSYYGFQSASGLNFNYPEGAALITQKGREILTEAVRWASGKSIEENFGSENKEDENDQD